MPQQGFYGPISEDVWQRAQKIKLLICDVDGVFSDGRIYLSNSGEELKAFSYPRRLWRALTAHQRFSSCGHYWTPI